MDEKVIDITPTKASKANKIIKSLIFYTSVFDPNSRPSSRASRANTGIR
jgi:hypothetical protein